MRKLALTLSAISATTVIARAASMVAFDNEFATPGSAEFTPSYLVSSTDLLNGLAPTESGGDFAATEITGGLPVLTDGTYGTITQPGGAADRTHLIFAIAGGGSGTGTFVTYTLDTSTNTLGYDLSSIVVYGGWNDSGRDQQLFTAAYSLVGSADFIDLPLVNFNPAIPNDVQSATRATFTDDTAALLATGVDQVRFTFAPSPENGYTGYAEIDVLGTATVPEPASAALLLCGIGALACRRSRK